MNKPLIAILGTLVLFLAACVQTGGTGRAVFAITDAAMNTGAITSVMVTVDSVQAHSTTEGWVTVSSTAKTYDLLQLKASGNTVTMADVQLSSGTYDQVRLDISNVVITDSNGTHTAKLPSGELKIVGGFDVKPNTTSAIVFDFAADRSIHVTGNGKYILAPVVHVQSKEEVQVEDKGDGKVEIKNGNTKTDTEVGMDVEGNVGEGLEIEDDKELEIKEDGKIGIKGPLGANATNKVKLEIS